MLKKIIVNLLLCKDSILTNIILKTPQSKEIKH